MTTYKMKPIEWKDNDDGYFSASVLDGVGSYYLSPDGDKSFSLSWCYDEYYNEGSESFDTIEEGKAWAQKDLESRMLNHLEIVLQ